MNFIETHIFKEGNECADFLANLGFNVANMTVWMDLPDCIGTPYVMNRLGFPNFKFKIFKGGFGFAPLLLHLVVFFLDYIYIYIYRCIGRK